MIIRFRKRIKGKDRFPHIEFDWEEGLIILRRLKYFPQYQTVYVGKAQNGYTKQWYEMYDVKPELNALMLKACQDQFGVEQALIEEMVVPGHIRELIPIKVSEVMVAPGEWRGEEWCRKYGKCTVKEYGERNKLLIRER